MPSSAAIEPPIGTPDIIMVATAARHFGANEFCGKGIGGGHEAAEAKAGDQAQGAEHHRAGREGAQRGEHRQDHGAADDGALAAYRVREPSGEDGADHHAQERQAAQGSRGRRR